MLGSLLIAWDDGGQALAGSFVGRVADSDAFVAIVTDGVEARAYVCDGTGDDGLSISEWFKGTVAGDAVDLTSESGTTQLRAVLTSTVVAGVIILADGTVFTFAASRAEAAAGFYLFQQPIGGVAHWAGWIVLPTGDLRGSALIGGRASPNVSFDTATNTASITGVGVVTAGQLTPDRTREGFQGCWPPLC